jgi:hydroxymethylpyrimidine pyrophosphatase-like HAD family hydrolase
MLQFAGMGVAMENAWPEVRQAADRITLSNDQDGVAVALQKLFPALR